MLFYLFILISIIATVLIVICCYICWIFEQKAQEHNSQVEECELTNFSRLSLYREMVRRNEIENLQRAMRALPATVNYSGRSGGRGNRNNTTRLSPMSGYPCVASYTMSPIPAVHLTTYEESNESHLEEVHIPCVPGRYLGNQHAAPQFNDLANHDTVITIDETAPPPSYEECVEEPPPSYSTINSPRSSPTHSDNQAELGMTTINIEF